MKYAPFGRNANRSAGPQLDLFIDTLPPDYALGPKQVHEFSGSVRWAATWKGEHAGSIFPCPEDVTKFEAYANLGFCLYSHVAGSTHSEWLGEFDTLEAAAAALEKRTREVRADPTLIWTLEKSRENIRRAKAKGWWRAAA